MTKLTGMQMYRIQKQVSRITGEDVSLMLISSKQRIISDISQIASGFATVTVDGRFLNVDEIASLAVKTYEEILEKLHND